jgi:hypothetical protein
LTRIVKSSYLIGVQAVRHRQASDSESLFMTDISSVVSSSNSIRMYDGCYVELRDGTVRGPVEFRTDIEPHMRPWLHETEAWFDHGGYRIQGGESPLDVVRVLHACHPGLELAIAIIKARVPLHKNFGESTALLEAVKSLRLASEGNAEEMISNPKRYAENRDGMVLRTAFLPKSMDAALRESGAYASRSSEGKTITDLVCSGLERMQEGAVIPRLPDTKSEETLVMRSVWFTPKIDAELYNRSFRRSQRRGQLVVDLIASEMARLYGSIAVDASSGNELNS